ncbi:MAG: type II toxin-antitoxin system RelE/ParE family toxin [Campylobacteraceae bacterium]|nr:type II toxin-antitoxin system RelE/ParE family toxin [Campylobacteraceae bacterium]
MIKVKYHRNFNNHILDLVDYIAKDSPNRAYKFYQDLQEKIDSIEMLYSYRKNRDLNRDDIRDLIFKGYVVPFRILDDSTILILDIYKRNLWNKEIK